MFEGIATLFVTRIGYILVGASNLIAPLYGYCLQFDGSSTCPVSPTPVELGWWMGVTWVFWLSVLIHDHKTFLDGSKFGK
jgi:membrane associated rhomboid family serine protease